MRKFFVESPGSFGEKARAKRFDLLLQTFPKLDGMNVLDLGGRVEFWNAAPVRPKHLTIVNSVESEAGAAASWCTQLVDDACNLSSEQLTQTYDLVFSNSTIEHVGDIRRMQAFARSVKDHASSYWIQTPNKRFPIEPHVIFPLHQYLPLFAKALVIRFWPLVHSNPSTLERARNIALETELLTRRQMAMLFPDAEIISETWGAALPAKSLIAV